MKRFVAKIKGIWLRNYTRNVVFVSTAFLALLLLLMSFSIEKISVHIHWQRIIESNKNYIAFIKNTVDTELQIAYNIAYRYARDTRVQSLAKNIYKNSLDVSDSEYICNLIYSNLSENKLIENVLIMYKDVPIVFSKEGQASYEFYSTDNIFARELNSFEDIPTDIIFTVPSYIKRTESKNETKTVLLYCVTKHCRINVFLNYDKIMSLFDLGSQYIKDVPIMVINSNNQLVIGNDYIAPEMLSELILPQIKTQAEIKIGNASYILTAEPSDSGWAYIMLYPVSLLKKEVAYITNYYRISYIIIVFMIMLLMLFYRKTILFPLQKLVSNCISTHNLTENEFFALGRYINVMNEQISEMSDFIEADKKRSVKNMIESLILGSIESEGGKIWSYTLNFIHDNFSYDIFLVVKFIMSPNSSTDQKSILNRLKDLLSALKAKCEHLLITGGSFYTIINFDENETMADEIAEALAKMLKDINRNGIELIGIMSDPIDDINDLSQSNHQIAMIQIRRNVNKPSKLYVMSDIIIEKMMFSTFISLKADFINALKDDSIKRSDEIIDKVFNKAKDISFEDAQAFLLYMHSIIIRLIAQTHIEPPQASHEYFMGISDENLAVIDLQKLEGAVRGICAYICHAYKKAKTNEEDVVIKYIKENYNNYISLDTVAQKFHMNPNYLSTYIKKTIGMNFVDYMRMLRIENAKIMLGEADSKIAQIATELGFPDSSVFIRYFKKSEGITPGQFKKLNS